MKSFKTMLLDIAFLIVAICGFLLLTVEWMIGLWMLFGGLILA